MLDAGDDGIPLTADDVITEDALLVTVENQPASPLLTVSAGGPFSSVVLTNYRITYDIPGEELEPIAGAMHLVVESGSSATASVVVVTALAKSVPPLSSLAAGGDELMGSATLTLRGYEQTSEDEIVSEATLAVHFANWQD